MTVFTTRRRRDERGAYSVLFALLSVLLFGLAALGVDLGNMYQRQAETQSQADLSALSAAPKLAVSQAAAVTEVAAYLNRNLKVGQTTVYASQLTDSKLTNGEVTFPTAYSMKVITPGAKVQFGLSVPLTQVTSSTVAAAATVGVGTPGADRLLPFFAVNGAGCDYGTQALSDPANGHTQSTVPALVSPMTNPSQTSNVGLSDLTPYQFATGATGAVITTINGSKLSSVTMIGFYRTSADSPNQVEVAIPSNADNSMISNVPVPTTVTNSPGTWWLRTYTSKGKKGWSPLDQSLPVSIGDGAIQCGSSSSSGNFGSLKLARSSQPSTWMPDNIAVGLQAPLSLSVQTNTASIPLCTPGGAGVVYSSTTGSGTSYANTNCVDTDTGLTAQPATQGLITGTGTGNPGRLVLPTTTSVPGRRCGVGHTTTERTMISHNLNDDTLSCFLNDPAMKLSEIAFPSYSGPAVLSPAIYDSPRFCYVPVLAIDPSNGGSQHYSIVDVRPCFITSEANDSSYNAQRFVDGSTSTTNNGLTIPSNKVTTIQVYFFNKKALPAEGPARPGVILSPDGPLVSMLTD